MKIFKHDDSYVDVTKVVAVNKGDIPARGSGLGEKFDVEVSLVNGSSPIRWMMTAGEFNAFLASWEENCLEWHLKYIAHTLGRNLDN